MRNYSAEKRSPTITYIHRNPHGNRFSISNVFETIASKLQSLSPNSFNIRSLSVPNYGTSLFTLISNVKYFLSVSSDVIHVTGDINYVSIIPRFSSRVILTIHDIGGYKDLKGIKKLIYGLFWIKLPSLACDALTAVSDKSKSDFLEIAWCAASKVTVIPNPIASFITPKLKLNRDALCTILIVGTGANKNVDRAFEALAGLNARCIVVGSLSIAQQAFAINTGLIVKNLVNLTGEELNGVYISSDILLFPSLHEGFGLPIIEAQSHGVSVITSSIEPMVSVAGPGGALLVDPYDVAAIRVALSRLINDRQLLHRLQAAGFKNSRLYSSDHIASRYAELYSNILAR